MKTIIETLATLAIGVAVKQVLKKKKTISLERGERWKNVSKGVKLNEFS